MTDHRAEAEKWLTEATDIWNEPRDYDDPPVDQLRIISRALVGIGHALLANLGSSQLAEPNEVPPDVAEAFGRRMAADQSETRFPVDISDLVTDQPEEDVSA